MDLRKSIYKIGKELQLVTLATITNEGKPWARYVMGMMNEELEFRFPTHRGTRKAEQISHNSNVHITLGVSDYAQAKQWIQLDGTAEVSTCQSEKSEFWNDSLNHFFESENDPNYAVVIVKPKHIELVTAGELTPQTIEFA